MLLGKAILVDHQAWSDMSIRDPGCCPTQKSGMCESEHDHKQLGLLLVINKSQRSSTWLCSPALLHYASNQHPRVPYEQRPLEHPLMVLKHFSSFDQKPNGQMVT
jgi:hypothetical protein